MTPIFAQSETDAIERLATTLDKVNDKLLSGVQDAAKAEPSSYLMVLLITVVAAAVIAIVVILLKDRKDQRVEQIEQKKLEDERAREHQKREEEREDKRMAAMQILGNACHIANKELEEKSAKRYISHAERTDQRIAAMLSSQEATLQQVVAAVENNTKVMEKQTNGH